ncbi:hypothetical protein TELCIR_09084 [Teladorsagia circumcincta]|uniref:RNA methyltransferase, TrmH family n=1 Tax=Teladorsagia circumcincta TaxID=45464 RepID=A0A2G9UFT5_TELCI|nr:hypothetical protein TELCIR_09084 [Teladorsagia circumcincta]
MPATPTLLRPTKPEGGKVLFWTNQLNLKEVPSAMLVLKRFQTISREAVQCKKSSRKTGKYWGYSVKLATSLKEVLDRKKFDVIIGTSPRGEPVTNMFLNTLNDIQVLLVFGGVSGVDAALEAEEALTETRAEEAFDRLVNSLPNKGTNSERVEENVFITLAEVTMRLQQLCSQ